MPSFQGSEFSVDLPDDALDVSSYCFAFPEAGDFAPNLTIRCDRRADEFNFDKYVSQQRHSLETSVENLAVVSEMSKSRGAWDYAVSVVEWGPEENRVSQKQLIVYVAGAIPRLYTLTGTDLAENFATSEPLFDKVMKSFKPTDSEAA